MADHDKRFALLTKWALENGGWATPAMAASAGIPPATYYRFVRRVGWPRIQPTIFGVPGVEIGWRAHVSAALERLGSPAAVTGRAGLRVHGVDAVEVRDHELLVVVPPGRSAAGTRPPVRVVHSATLRARDVTEIDGLWVPAPGWCLLHLARAASTREVLAAALAARQAAVLTIEHVDDVLARAGTAPGVPALRAARDELVAGGQVDSILERDARRLLAAHGLVPDPAPFPFECPDGRVIHLDIAFPGHWAAWEVDGFSAHGRSSFESDRTRWRQAKRAGWEIDWITSRRLRDDPVGLIEEVRSVLAAADPDRPAPDRGSCARRTCRVCR